MNEVYVAPSIEIIEVEVEKGFAGSLEDGNSPFLLKTILVINSFAIKIANIKRKN